MFQHTCMWRSTRKVLFFPVLGSSFLEWFCDRRISQSACVSPRGLRDPRRVQLLLLFLLLFFLLGEISGSRWFPLDRLKLQNSEFSSCECRSQLSGENYCHSSLFSLEMRRGFSNGGSSSGQDGTLRDQNKPGQCFNAEIGEPVDGSPS